MRKAGSLITLGALLVVFLSTGSPVSAGEGCYEWRSFYLGPEDCYVQCKRPYPDEGELHYCLYSGTLWEPRTVFIEYAEPSGEPHTYKLIVHECDTLIADHCFGECPPTGDQFSMYEYKVGQLCVPDP